MGPLSPTQCLSLRSKIGIPSIGSEGPLRSPDEEICPDERSEEGPFPKSDEGFLSRTADGSREVLLGRFCQLQCLQIRSHDVGDPADFGGGSDLVGRLRCEIVKPERGEQADDSLRDLVSRLNEGGVLGAN